jgi:formamidopyrimidine-DNA glycosylase
MIRTTIPKKGAHAAFDFNSGTLLLTEAGTKKKAALHLVRGREALEELNQVTVESLTEWTDRLKREAGGAFPEKVTAFHPKMGAHGKYEKPCPICQTPIQRIVYESRETNYCPTCQTGGKLLADRSLSRILREDWPRTLEELEELKKSRRKD